MAKTYVDKAREYAADFQSHGMEVETRAGVGYMAGYAEAIADAAKVVRRIMHTLPGVALSESVAAAIEKLVTPAAASDASAPTQSTQRSD